MLNGKAEQPVNTDSQWSNQEACFARVTQVWLAINHNTSVFSGERIRCSKRIPRAWHAGGSDFRLYDGSDLETYLLMRWLGPDALAVCWTHRGLPVGFLLLWYLVLFTMEFLSLLYLLVIS